MWARPFLRFVGMVLVSATATLSIATARPESLDPPTLRNGISQFVLEEPLRPAPLIRLRGLDGRPLRMQDLKGKHVVLNFWASWCDPCKEEATTLQQAAVDYADKNVVFIGADYLDQEPAAMRYLQQFKITYANGPDLASQIARRYRIQGVPETFFIKPDGTVDWFKIGPLSDSELRACLDQLIAGGSCK